MNLVRTFGKNEVIFKEGAMEWCMYEIKSGSVNIYADYGKEEQKLLTTLEAGQFFGEIGIAEAMPRTATAIAAEEQTNLAEITADNFSAYFQQEPQKLLAIMKHMSARMRALTKDYMEARETMAEAITTAKSGQKQSGSLKEKLGKLVQNLKKPAFMKKEEAFEEASFLSAQGDAQFVVKTFGKNEVIFHEGDAANCIYDVHAGTVGIYANYGAENQNLLVELKQDAFFGEMGMLEHMPRSTTAVALENGTKVQLISEELFGKYLQERPAKVLMILMHLSSRIRALTKDYMEVCRLAETAQEADNDPGAWANYMAEEIYAEYGTWDFASYCYSRHYWG